MRVLCIAGALLLTTATTVLAQSATTPDTKTPSTAPNTTTAPTTPSTTTPSTTTPGVTTPGTSTQATVPAAKGVVLTEAEAKAWIDKPVYSSDGKHLGEVAAFTRDASGKVNEMHADIGGFLGLGETRVRLMPDQFSMSNDRVVLNVASEQAKSLPQIPKQ